MQSIEEAVNYFGGEELPATVWAEKYAARNLQSVRVEVSPTQMHRRLAKEFARIEKKKFKKPYSEDYLFSLFDKFSSVIPQGSPMAGIGVEQLVSLSNCFVVAPPTDSYGGIMRTDEQMVQLCKRRGGVGTDLSHIRPDDLPTSNSARKATGVVPFMRRYSNTIREVGQAGRRGALMLTLSVHHPQILDFARIKMNPDEVTGANVSVRLSDEFLSAVKAGTTYEQRWPVDSPTPQIRKQVDARTVWKEIITCAHARAEPGLLFWDHVLRDNPAECYADVGFGTVATNPCCINEHQNVMIVTKEGLKELKQVTSEDLIWVDDTQEWKRTSGYFKAGEAEVFRVTLSNGAVLEVTANHKLYTPKFVRQGTKMVVQGGELAEVSSLAVGDKIMVHHNQPEGVAFGNYGNWDDGVLLGWLVGDGCLSFKDASNAFPTAYWDFWTDDLTAQPVISEALTRKGYAVAVQKVRTYNKVRVASDKFVRGFTEETQTNPWLLKSDTEVAPLIYKGSRDFLRGYLAAYFSADGTVACTESTVNYAVQLASINRSRLEQVRDLLLLFGVKSSIGLMRVAGECVFSGGKKYATKDCFRLTITGIDNLRRFHSEIGFIVEPKQTKLDFIATQEQQRESKGHCYAQIRSIESIGVCPVGCIEVEDAHRFTANGVISGNSEIPLSILDACRLLVVNLFTCVVDPFKKKASFDFLALYDLAYVAQRLMDDLVDLEIECIDRILKKIDSDPEPEEVKRTERELWEAVRTSVVNGRRTGLGPTALGDAIAAVGLKYGSDESVAFTEEVYKTLKLAAYRSSVDMAKELGAFPVWDADKERDCPFLLRIAEEDPKLYRDMQKYGRRNIALLTTAPVGSVSLLAKIGPYFGSCSGIEPLFNDKPYTRRKKINHAEVGARVDFVDPQGDRWTEFEVKHAGIKLWSDVTGETDWKKSPYHKCCAEDLDWKQRVKLQAAAQKHIDHAISSTINLPEEVSVEKVAEIYQAAWEQGCKGITVYRKNCRTGVLVDQPTAAAAAKRVKTAAPKRPKELECEVHHTSVKGQPCVVLVGLLEGEPYEAFALLGGREPIFKCKSGTLAKEKRGHYRFGCEGGEWIDVTEQLSDEQAAVTRLVSTSLRHGVDTAFVVQQLEKVKGEFNGFAKAVARTLKKYIKDGTKVSGDKCEKCGSEHLVRQEGCVLCMDCGHSKCN